MEVEVTRGGLDSAGLPYFVWRESGDNRFGLSRPRYCCITPKGEDLHLTFFNPSEDVKPTGANSAFIGVCILMGVLFIVEMIAERFRGVPGPREYPPGPLFSLIAFFGTAMILGGLVYYVWDGIATVWRWRTSRFAGDGRITSVPWRQLVAFRVVTPEENGVQRGPDEKKVGEDLQATFGMAAAPWALTANKWNNRSVVNIHRELTVLFIGHRDECLANWDRNVRDAKKAPPKTGGGNGPDFEL